MNEESSEYDLRYTAPSLNVLFSGTCLASYENEMYLYNEFLMKFIDGINATSFYTIELTLHTSCHLGLGLTLCCVSCNSGQHAMSLFLFHKYE